MCRFKLYIGVRSSLSCNCCRFLCFLNDFIQKLYQTTVEASKAETQRDKTNVCTKTGLLENMLYFI